MARCRVARSSIASRRMARCSMASRSRERGCIWPCGAGGSLTFLPSSAGTVSGEVPFPTAAVKTGTEVRLSATRSSLEFSSDISDSLSGVSMNRSASASAAASADARLSLSTCSFEGGTECCFVSGGSDTESKSP